MQIYILVLAQQGERHYLKEPSLHPGGYIWQPQLEQSTHSTIHIIMY